MKWKIYELIITACDENTEMEISKLNKHISMELTETTYMRLLKNRLMCS